MARVDIVQRLIKEVGSEYIKVISYGDGWPSIVDVKTTLGVRRLAVHATTISSHARKPHEFRLQAPASGKAISNPGGALPIYVAIDAAGKKRTLFVADASYRLGMQARTGPLFNIKLLKEARENGWSEQAVRPGQEYYAIYPVLFPSLIDAIESSISDIGSQICEIISVTGLTSNNADDTKERARRLASTYVRDARFSKNVRSAYNHRCALCAIQLDLVVGAHIYPVNAPGSRDEVWNGVALCHNHHIAYDAHKIWIKPDLSVVIRPDIENDISLSITSRNFISTTAKKLIVPVKQTLRPKKGMIEKRRKVYAKNLEWVV